MSLNTKQKQELKGRAHKLKPVIMIGHQGLTDAVNKEIYRALNDHELIKVRVQSTDRDYRREIFAEIIAAQEAELIQVIGSIGVIYRKNTEK